MKKYSGSYMIPAHIEDQGTEVAGAEEQYRRRGIVHGMVKMLSVDCLREKVSYEYHDRLEGSYVDFPNKQDPDPRFRYIGKRVDLVLVVEERP